MRASLSASLNRALALLNDNNPDNDSSACGKLDKFIHQVSIKTAKGITSEQALALLDEANTIKEALLTCQMWSEMKTVYSNPYK